MFIINFTKDVAGLLRFLKFACELCTASFSSWLCSVLPWRQGLRKNIFWLIKYWFLENFNQHRNSQWRMYSVYHVGCSILCAPNSVVRCVLCDCMKILCMCTCFVCICVYIKYIPIMVTWRYVLLLTYIPPSFLSYTLNSCNAQLF